MSIRIHKLIISGGGKKDAVIDTGGESHLVFGPTDTGKSYIVECLRYCLGSDEHPRDIGYSEGYSLAALQISTIGGHQFTLFRDLRYGTEAVYEGFYNLPPHASSSPVPQNIGEMLLIWSSSTGKKIITKSGKISSLAPGDIRYLSLFDEIETLDKVPLEGKDKLFKMKRRSTIALVMSGIDDSNMPLVPTTDKRNIAKGHVEAIEEEMRMLASAQAQQPSMPEVEIELAVITSEIERFNTYLQSNIQELTALKSARAEIERKIRKVELQLVNLKEASGRFKLLDSKYVNDLQRLHALSSAAAVVSAFPVRTCPLCRTDLTAKVRGLNLTALRHAAAAEVEKIEALRRGLVKALKDVEDEIQERSENLNQLRKNSSDNVKEQEALIQPITPSGNKNITELTNRKSNLLMVLKDLERIDLLRKRHAEMKDAAKKQKQLIKRDMSTSTPLLCARVSELLTRWGVPGVESIFFDESKADLFIDNRERISYGKGKRGIFLTAYVVALMERALHIGSPHLGFVVIDSPVVTYKDPKHGSTDENEALDPAVKNRFYAWLAERTEPGQVVVLENEEPPRQLLGKLPFTEFIGAGGALGRKGFFPA